MGAAEAWRTLGPAGFASYAFGRAAGAVPGLSWHRYRLVAVPRAGMPAMPRGFRAGPLGPDDVASAAALLELPQAAQDHRFRQGMTCIGAWRGDRLVGVNWLTNGPFDEDEVAVRFVPPPGSAWDTGLYVRPDDRGGRAFAALWAGSAQWLAAHDLAWSMSRIADYNLPSLRSHLRMGGIELGRFAALRAGGRQWLFGAQPVLLLPVPERFA
jgi:hypothetical protein